MMKGDDNMTTTSKLYTVSEVAKVLRTNVNRVYDLIHSGELPALKLGCYKIRFETLEQFLIDREG